MISLIFLKYSLIDNANLIYRSDPIDKYNPIDKSNLIDKSNSTFESNSSLEVNPNEPKNYKCYFIVIKLIAKGIDIDKLLEYHYLYH